MIVNASIYTPTLEDFVEVVGYAIRNGFKWNNDSSEIKEEYWYIFENNTCIYLGLYNQGYYMYYNSYNHMLDRKKIPLSMKKFYSKLEYNNYIRVKYGLI